MTLKDTTSDARLREIIDAWNRNDRNVRATAREFGLTRQTVQSHLANAVKRGLLVPEDREPSFALREDYITAREAKLRAFEARKKTGNWRKPVMVNLPARPCILILMGDPHLDNDGTDFALFERVWQQMGPHVHGICVGDWFDNWRGALAHLHAEASVKPSDAWTLLDWLMEENGEHLLAACSGNHDDWSHGPVDPVWALMRRHGVVYRRGAIRLALNFGGRVVTVAVRHKWRGRSMYSAAHWGARATRDGGGWWDHIMVGGHTHQDEDRSFQRAEDGFIARAFQISAFKQFDKYADVEGFSGQRIAPVRYLVVDPSRPDSDPDMVRCWYDFDRAMGDLEGLLRAAA